MTAPASPPAARLPALAWVALVIVVGALLGFGLSFANPHPPPYPGPGGPGMMPPNVFRPAQLVGGVLLALLAALLVVYSRTYLETRARFALGLVVFLVALLWQAILGSAVLFNAVGAAPGSVEPFLFVSSIIECVAFAIFLYISLQ
jgi:hypothetical protein